MNTTEFAAQYGTQLLSTRRMIGQLQELVKRGLIPENTLIAALQSIEKTYDKLVVGFIYGAINAQHQHFSTTDICSIALQNYHANGTEPQFALYAINDVYQYIIRQTKQDNIYPLGI